MMIFKKITAAILFVLLTVSLCFAARKAEIPEEIKAVFDTKFSGETKSMVAQAQAGEEEYYFILTVGENIFDDEEYEIKKRFKLIAKLSLLNELQKNDRSLTGVEVKGWTDSKFWVEGGKHFLFSYVKSDNVFKSYEREEVMEALGEDNDYIQEQISKLQSYVQENPKAINEFEELYRLYLLTGDIDKAYETKTEIMDLKFEL